MTKIIHTTQELSALRAEWRSQKAKVGLVPTMGALHAGHLSLIPQVREQVEKVVVSIFVNPTQFGPNEDFARYPRHEARDITKLTSMGVDAIYLPKAEAMYPKGYATVVHVAGLGEGLCGPLRPGHFDGVATVVAKLLIQVMPDVAIFGEKDYQQLQVIRHMAKDLNLPVKILDGATIREKDGLAMSSRNQYLSDAERVVATALFRILQQTATALRAQPEAVEALLVAGEKALFTAGFQSVDYLQLCDAETLKPLGRLEGKARLLVAAYLGKTRLIDNIAVE